MYQLTQLADEINRQRLAHASQQRPAQRLLTNRRAEWRMRRAARQPALAAEGPRLQDRSDPVQPGQIMSLEGAPWSWPPLAGQPRAAGEDPGR
ncbi:MAG: hypothetical protein ACLQDY_27660 [Streptosporangiaceae bacterium]